MDQSDDLTFRVNFGGDGVAKLRDRVKEKLKEFMGDYTDDTLVEYVIVLLKNGRRKVEAKNELNVFLGADSDSFVSWLWDHLEKHIDLYVQPKEVKTKSTIKEQAQNLDSHHMDAEHEREKPNELSRNRHGRGWKSLVKDAVETPPLRSVVTANIHVDEDAHMKVSHLKRSSPPRPVVQRKRRRPDEKLHIKKDDVSKTLINAPRRLLQSAVRDALGSPTSARLSTEPSFKRIRSVVSTSVGDSSLVDCTQSIQSVARVPDATMAVAIKAVAEAAKDVVKVRSSGNVFDRLGRGMDVLDTSAHMAESREVLAEAVEEYGGYDYFPEEKRTTHLQRSDFDERYSKKRTVLESYPRNASDFVSDNELYEGGRLINHNGTDVSDSGASVGNKDDSLLVQYSVASKADQSTFNLRKDQYQSVADNNSTVNISVNVNTWKPPQYRGASPVSSRKIVQRSDARADKLYSHPVKENKNPIAVGNGNAIPAADGQRESQKELSPTTGTYAAGLPAEDVESRTIFISNVHFAANKDSLSRHFNKFGDVLKVIIVTDAATGQPKGSAFVEFTSREAAEQALSLNGTSFMSRILKVVMKSAAPPEPAPVMTFPRISRGSMFTASRFGRVPFPRGIPGSFRARLPIKSGARSFQWKRGAQMASDTPSVSDISVPSTNAPRSLTYIRTEAKANANSSIV
ncbi:putative PWI domain, nucleotide-binding alpha-beta plait domain-containing protein [Heracleum sosnowskyi]|uniref:PWI domain, nucleotide-binding alpha-beta plait domain-containing protein n=1 Tax=Heracleum sosnowskyi TaxID=360622 RepID=A0AAD8ICX8_9APIA|nr:putative PWI domain, nucleotide-binding alpha-beta plait domain-containing protein [Heracleum sosnowskyi]